MARKTLDSLAAEIERKIKAFEASGWENLERARDLGIDLIAAKDACVREERKWLEWLEEREIENQRAGEWIYLARNWDKVRALFPTVGNAGVRGVVKALKQTAKEGKSRTGTPPPPEGLYRLILADPPWEYDFSPTDSRKIENHYDTMPVSSIAELKQTGHVRAAPDCLLLLWATSPKLQEALVVMKAWEFEYKTHAIWDKGKIGMGYWFRGQHELLLVGTCGNAKPPPPDQLHSSVIREDRGKHSKKPEAVYQVIEDMYPDYDEPDRIEMFAREKREGWSFWGAECQNEISTKI